MTLRYQKGDKINILLDLMRDGVPRNAAEIDLYGSENDLGRLSNSLNHLCANGRLEKMPDGYYRLPKSSLVFTVLDTMVSMDATDALIGAMYKTLRKELK